VAYARLRFENLPQDTIYVRMRGAMFSLKQLPLIFRTGIPPRYLSRDKIERAQEKHEVASVNQPKSRGLGELPILIDAISPQVVGHLIVVAPENLQCGRRHKQLAAGSQRFEGLPKDFTVVGTMLDNVKQKSQIPSIAPT
jgi:hypothetical protein